MSRLVTRERRALTLDFLSDDAMCACVEDDKHKCLDADGEIKTLEHDGRACSDGGVVCTCAERTNLR